MKMVCLLPLSYSLPHFYSFLIAEYQTGALACLHVVDDTLINKGIISSRKMG